MVGRPPAPPLRAVRPRPLGGQAASTHRQFGACKPAPGLRRPQACPAWPQLPTSRRCGSESPGLLLTLTCAYKQKALCIEVQEARCRRLHPAWAPGTGGPHPPWDGHWPEAAGGRDPPGTCQPGATFTCDCRLDWLSRWTCRGPPWPAVLSRCPSPEAAARVPCLGRLRRDGSGFLWKWGSVGVPTEHGQGAAWPPQSLHGD